MGHHTLNEYLVFSRSLIGRYTRSLILKTNIFSNKDFLGFRLPLRGRLEFMDPDIFSVS